MARMLAMQSADPLSVKSVKSAVQFLPLPVGARHFP